MLCCRHARHMVIFISESEREPLKSYFKVACTGTYIITKELNLSQPNECRLSLAIAILKVQSTFTKCTSKQGR